MCKLFFLSTLCDQNHSENLTLHKIDKVQCLIYGPSPITFTEKNEKKNLSNKNKIEKENISIQSKQRNV